MAHNIKVSTQAANIKADAWGAQLDGGSIRIYEGTQPATANSPLGSAILLAELTMGDPAFSAAEDGEITANPITKDSSAAKTGTAKFYRLFAKDGTTPLGDGSCGDLGSNSDLELTTSTIVQFGEVTCTGFTHQESLG